MTQKFSITTDQLKVFETLPDPYLILSPGLLILTASEAYLKATFTVRDQIVGKSIFEVFPDNPDTPHANSVSNIRASLQQVLATKKPHLVAVQRYDVPLPEGSGKFEKKYWQALNTPVLDEKGEVLYIIHKAIDVTAQVDNQHQIDALKGREQAALQEADWERKKLYELFMQAPALISVVSGPAYVYELVNPQYQQLFPGRELLGKPLLEAVPEIKHDPIVQILDKVYTTGETFTGNEIPVPLDRLGNGKPELVYFNFIYQALRDAQGKITGIITFAQEVTNQVKARKKIEESEHQVRSIIESSPFPVGVFVGKEMRVQFANKAIQEVWDKGPGVIGKRFRDVLPELENQEVFEQLERVFETGIPFHSRNNPIDLLINERLQTFYFNYSLTPLFNAAGEVYGIINSGADETELVLAKQRVEESESRFRHMIEQAPVAIGLTRGNNHFIEKMNTPMLRIVGKNREEVVGKNLTDVMPEIKDNFVLKILNTVLETGEAYRGNEVPFTYKLEEMQEQHFLNVSYTPLVEEGEVTGVIHVAVDVTEQVEAREKIEEGQEELKNKNTQLIRINNDLDSFIYTASHDLKAPISNIEALLNALLRTLPPESLAAERPKRITSMMQESIERFKKTIANLTEVVKLQKENSGEAMMVDLSEVIKDVRLDLEQMIQSSGAQIEVDVSDCPTIHFSEKNLRSVVYNLLSNAIKYRAPERVPRVQITCKSTSDYQLLSVKDNGLGMDPRRTDQLFTMFKRLHSHVEGTGIGLYMVKKMVENAGGRIEVESQLGEGTTFHVYFKC